MESEGLVIPFSAAEFAGLSEIGGKANFLARCQSLGVPIPKGVILSARCYRDFINGKEIKFAYSAVARQFQESEKIIIRSSAIEEDGQRVSFAGQFKTLVADNDINMIRERVEACWRSYSGETARVYRESLAGGKKGGAGMALLIQQLLNASASGVCFTADPLTGHRGKIIINAVHGLGEALMSGEVVSDHWEYDVGAKSCSRRVSGEQKEWRSPGNPDVLTALPEVLQGKPVLNDGQIEEVVSLCKKVERLMQFPVDIEWAYESGKLFLIQVRPITALVEEKEMTIWTRDNAADVIPDAVTPLTWSIVGKATNRAFNLFASKIGSVENSANLFELFESRVYFNQTAYGKTFSAFSRPQRKIGFFLRAVKNYLYMILFSGRQIRRLQEGFPKVVGVLPGETNASRIWRLKNHLEQFMAVHVQIVGLLEMGFLILRKIGKRHLPGNKQAEIIDGLVKGLGRVESAYSGKALRNLARLIMQDPALKKAIVQAPVDSVPKILGEWEGCYGDKWREYFENYGHSALKEFEIYYPRWEEDPSFIVETLKRLLEGKADSNLFYEGGDNREGSMLAESFFLRKSPLLFFLPLKFYIRHIRRGSIWRELLKQRILRIMGEMRKAALSYAKEKDISPREDVFFMSLHEIMQLGKSPITGNLIREISVKKNGWAKNKLERPFKEIRIYGDGRRIRIPYGADDGQLMTGIPLSSGKYVGPAKVVCNPADLRSFNWGDVLVAPSTNPSWTPVFSLAGAIVTDMGNYLSHGAIVARELGIPAVGNLFCATSRIKNGQMIAVDGDEGWIKLIGEEKEETAGSGDLFPRAHV